MWDNKYFAMHNTYSLKHPAYSQTPRYIVRHSQSISCYILIQVGHQDFFPSGGQHQVSCLPFDHICYHLRVVDFFTESITSSCSFRAYPCNSWLRFLKRKCRKCGDSGCSRMGYFADLSPARGSFMLGTSVNEPYCRQDSGVPPSFWGRFLG